MKNLYNPSLKDQRFDAIVIGSGLGGLTTAVLLAKNKKKVLVLERHYEPGGFTHTFKRRKYSWDVGVHYVGQVNNEKSLMRKIFDYVTDGKQKWACMGDVYDKAIIEGQTYEFVPGLDNQIKKLQQYFPEELPAIQNYFKLVKSMGIATGLFFGERTMPPFLSKTIGYFLRKKFLRYSRETTYTVLKRLTNNERLISVLCAQCGNYGLSPQKSSFAIQAIITEHYLSGGSYPVGGSSSIHQNLLAVLEQNNGTLALKAEVANVLIENKKAVGVLMKNGDRLLAPIIISNAGAHNTFNKLIPQTATLPPALYKEINNVRPSISHICIYVGLNLSDQELKLPKCNYWIYKNDKFDEEFENHLANPLQDPPLAYISFPSAKDPNWPGSNLNMSTIQVIVAASYTWVKHWEEYAWQKKPESYALFKEGFKDKMLDKLYNLVPQVKGHIEYCEVSTPLSTKHFSNYQEGEIYGLEHTPARFNMKYLRVHTPIKNLFLTGQDLITVGVGGALFSGVLTASAVLRKNVIWNALRYNPTKN